MNAAAQALVAPHAELLARYDLGVIQDAAELSGGMFLRPLLLTMDRGKFVLRGTWFRPSTTSFAFLATVMEHALTNGVRCPRVVRDRNGDFGHSDGNACWAVVEYLEGFFYDWRTWCETMANAPGFAEGVARQVAQTHTVLAHAPIVGDPRLDPDLPPIQFRHVDACRASWERGLTNVLGRDVPGRGPAIEQLRLLRAHIGNHWDWLATTATDHGIGEWPLQSVHGDISPVNLLFRDGQAEFCIIDWDCVHLGTRLYDALGDVLLRPPWDEPRFVRPDLELVRRYLAAYCRAADPPLEPDELACVGAFCVARQLEDLRQRVRVLAECDGKLPPQLDEQYAALIGIRVSAMDFIRASKSDTWTTP